MSGLQRRWRYLSEYSFLEESELTGTTLNFEQLFALQVRPNSEIYLIHDDGCVHEDRTGCMLDICDCCPEEKMDAEIWAQNRALMKKFRYDSATYSLSYLKAYLRSELVLAELDQAVGWCGDAIDNETQTYQGISEVLALVLEGRARFTSDPPNPRGSVRDKNRFIIEQAYQLHLSKMSLQEAQKRIERCESEIAEFKKTLIIESTPLYPDVAGVVMKELALSEET